MTAPTEREDAAGPTRVLVVEDEPHIRELVSLHLRFEGLQVIESAAGDDAIRITEAEPFDLVILDLMLPRVDGMTVCRAIRRQPANGDVPILMLTARRDESDKVLGLESGADDYLTKPFGVRELVARVRALLRRPRMSQLAPQFRPNALVVAGPLKLDPARRQAVVESNVVELTPQEFDLLHLLASRPGIVFTRAALLEQVWANDTHVTERSIDSVIKRLRQKIEVDAREPRLILTVWGTGYKFTDA